MAWTITDDDQELYYDVTGDGHPLMFIGGFAGITDVWEAQTATLGGDFLCITYDPRGYGRSDKPVPAVRYGVERHMRDVGAVMDAAGADRAIVVGHSMGGNTALRLALDRPERVSALVLVASFASGSQVLEAAAPFDVAAFIKNAIIRKQSRYEFFLSSGATHEVCVESTKWPTYAVAGNMETFLAFEAREEIRRLTLPVLVVHGDADQISPLDPCGRYLADTIPGARLEVLEGGNHCPMVQRPEWFNDVLRRFVEAVAQGQSGFPASPT